MKLFHTSPARNLGSILQFGILRRFAQVLGGHIWLHPRRLRNWAREHVRERHKIGARGAVVVFEVNLPAHWVTCRPSGLRTVCLDVPPESLRVMRALPDDGIVVA